MTEPDPEKNIKIYKNTFSTDSNMAGYFRFVNKTVLLIVQLFLAHARCPICVFRCISQFDHENKQLK